jgi:hypothetical protein
MWMILSVVLALTVAGCPTGSGTGTGSPPVPRIGDYTFRISLPARTPIDGAFTIVADTVSLDTDGQPCRHDTGLTGSRRSHLFSCFPPIGMDSFSVTIDVYEPAMSSWAATQSVKKSRTVCVRFTTTLQGRQVCAETRTEEYFDTVRIGGRLRLTARD